MTLTLCEAIHRCYN